CAPVPEIEVAAVLEVATLIAAAHHAVIGAGTHRPPHRHHAHPCLGGPSDWTPSLAQRSIRRKCRSDCIRSPASQGRIAGYRIGRDQSAYVRAQLAHSKGLSVIQAQVVERSADVADVLITAHPPVQQVRACPLYLQSRPKFGTAAK